MNDADFQNLRDEAMATTCEEWAHKQGWTLKKGIDRAGPCPNCGGTDRFSVHTRKNIFNCRGCGLKGSGVIDLVMQTEGLKFLHACERITGRRVQDPADEKNLARMREEAARKEREAERERERKENDVRALWAESVAYEGTLAEAYLVRRMGETFATLPAIPTLRFHPEMYCKPAKEAGLGARHPCLVAAVQKDEGKVAGIWRIFLKPDATNLTIWNEKLQKDEKLKMGLGNTVGGMVRLTPIAPEMNVGEGLESTLGARMLERWCGAWGATLSTSGMQGLDIPSKVRRLHIWSDGDKHRLSEKGIQEPPGQNAATKLCERAMAQGVIARIHEPPTGSDWADVWEMGK